MGTNVNFSVERFKEVALLDSTRQALLSAAHLLLLRLSELKAVFYSTDFDEAVSDYFDVVELLVRILGEQSSVKCLFDTMEK